MAVIDRQDGWEIRRRRRTKAAPAAPIPHIAMLAGSGVAQTVTDFASLPGMPSKCHVQ
jgi:hypothetical protein